MSGCFPYSPPGYKPSLMGSIIGVGMGTEKKKKKTHKREKAEKIKHSKNGQRKDGVMSTKEEVECSCITEEHGDPSNYESDCSSTGKRKRQGLCSPIKPDQKRLKSDQIPTSRDNPVEFRSTRIGRGDSVRNPACHISRQYREMRNAAQQYRDLIENWNPPAFSMFLDSDCDDDWLSGCKKRVNPNPPEKTSSSCCSSTLWPPRARFLPDASTYALPYVLPF